MKGDDLRRINLLCESVKSQENGHELHFDIIITQTMINFLQDFTIKVLILHTQKEIISIHLTTNKGIGVHVLNERKKVNDKS